MQDMHLRTRLAGETNKPLGRTQSRDLVAPDRMRGRIAGDPQGLALIQARLVLAVERRAPAGLLEDGQHPCVVGDQ